MKTLRRIAVLTLTVVCFAGIGLQAEACSGHHSSSRHTSGVYCSYHHKRHTKKTACARYCKKHKTTHANGKKHC